MNEGNVLWHGVLGMPATERVEVQRFGRFTGALTVPVIGERDKTRIGQLEYGKVELPRCLSMLRIDRAPQNAHKSQRRAVDFRWK